MKLGRFILQELSHPSSSPGILRLQRAALHSSSSETEANEAIRQITENKATICYLPSATRAVKIWYSNKLVGAGHGRMRDRLKTMAYSSTTNTSGPRFPFWIVPLFASVAPHLSTGLQNFNGLLHTQP
jgi:hypothetical protein